MRQTADCASASQQNFPPHSPHSLGGMATRRHDDDDDDDLRLQRVGENRIAKCGRMSIAMRGMVVVQGSIVVEFPKKGTGCHLRGSLYAFGSLPSRRYTV